MVYNKGVGEYKNWLVEEEDIIRLPGKCESIMCLGNGYLGLRSSIEEDCPLGCRTLLVAGTFDKADDIATELANAADITAMNIKLNGEYLDLSKGIYSDYSRTLNLKTGLLTRTFIWTTENGTKAKFEFSRVVSLKDKHLIAAKASITPLDDNIEIYIESGIDGDTRIAPQHFSPVQRANYNGVLQLISKTNESGILFAIDTYHKLYIGGNCATDKLAETKNESMQIKIGGNFEVKTGQEFILTKISNVFTNRDKEYDGYPVEQLIDIGKNHMNKVINKSFDEIAKESADEWAEKIWAEKDIQIDTANEENQLAIRFAIYHLTIMSPTHDNRMNIGAKGLSGKGYKGHSFWDTEVYMLPFFIFASPFEARSLLEHRYNGIEAARKNAKERGYDGAMYPWESAWITDGETTPTWATTGLLEHHITADIAFAVYYYYTVTGDKDFMDKYGYEIIFDTAKFWLSRLEYNKELDRYEINDVIGPDEYKENVNNNAFTNHMAYKNISLAILYADRLKEQHPEKFDQLNSLLNIDEVYPKWVSEKDKIYLPRENADGLIPQDDTYLTLPDIVDRHPELSLSEWAPEARGVIKELDLAYNELQISKQADIMALFYLMEDLFTPEVKKKNFYYYEKRCFHDSSLSLSTYSVLAADLRENEQAYKLFNRATMIDLGPVEWSSEEGIHAASLGGIWQCTVLGFAGVRLYGEELRIQPNLPDSWNSVKAIIYWKGQKLNLEVNRDSININNLTGTKEIQFLCNGKINKFTENISLKY